MMKMIAIALAMALPAAADARDLAAETAARAPSMEYDSPRARDAVEACVATKWNVTPVAIPGGVRLVLPTALALVDLTKSDTGTHIVIRTRPMGSALVFRTVKHCAEGR